MDDEPVILRWGALSPELSEALGRTRALGAAARGTERAWPLLDALGVDAEDDRFEFFELDDGRWALIGRRVEGARFVIEPEPPKAANPWRMR
jgi:hypothetical protein